MDNPEKCIEVCRRVTSGENLNLPSQVLANLFITAQYFEMKQSYTNMALPMAENNLNLAVNAPSITIPRVALNKLSQNSSNSIENESTNIDSIKRLTNSSTILTSRSDKEVLEINESSLLTNSNLQKKFKKKKNSINNNLSDENTTNKEKSDDSLSSPANRDEDDDKNIKHNIVGNGNQIKHEVGNIT